MTSDAQHAAAKRNVRKAQATWKSMTHRQRALAQPQGRRRKKPGTGGQGRFYRIVVRPKERFVSFRNHDVGQPGHIQRIAGKRSSGSWATATWLIGKEDAHIEAGRLVADSLDARKLLRTLGSVPVHAKGDVFEAKPRRNVPEREKPTMAQRRAQRRNIKKAQAARRARAM